MPLVVHITTVPASLVFLDGQVAFMRERGFEVVAISSPGPELDAFGQRESVRVVGVPMPRRITPLRDLASVLRLWRTLTDLSPDIVHAHTPKGGLLGMIAGTMAGVPVRIYHMRGLPLMTATGLRAVLLTATEKVSCALAHEVLCVSHSLREVALERGLCPPDRIRVLGAGSGQGVDARGRFDPARSAGERARVRAELGIPSDALVYGFVGRIVRDKGIVELAEAWQRVREEVPSAHLILAGVREAKDPVPASTMGMFERDPRVHELGFCGDTPALYSALDVVVLPTYREGFPNVPLEAAAMGIPVIATRIPGCVDAVLDGETSILVAPRNASDLAAAMEHYAAEPELRARHGQAGRHRALHEFDRPRVWSRIADLYDRTLECAGHAPARDAHSAVGAA